MNLIELSMLLEYKGRSYVPDIRTVSWSSGIKVDRTEMPSSRFERRAFRARWRLALVKQMTVRSNLDGLSKLKSLRTVGQNTSMHHRNNRNSSINQVCLCSSHLFKTILSDSSRTQPYAIRSQLRREQWSSCLQLCTWNMRLRQWNRLDVGWDRSVMLLYSSSCDHELVATEKAVDQQRCSFEILKIPLSYSSHVSKVEIWWKLCKCTISRSFAPCLGWSLLCWIGANSNTSSIFATISTRREIRNGSIFVCKIFERTNAIGSPLWTSSKYVVEWWEDCSTSILF